MMTKDEAIAEAAKRESHKSPGLSHKRWAAVHDSVKGWHVALIDDHAKMAALSKEKAMTAYRRGDVDGVINHLTDSLISEIRAQFEPQGNNK